MIRPRSILPAILSVILLLPPLARAQSANTLNIDERRSLIVTELSVLGGFTLKRTMDQLAAQSGVPGLTGEALFRQWMDIMNPLAEARTSGGPHCDDQTDPVTGGGLLNGFPFTCRPASLQSEGLEAALATDPMAGYIPITLTNRLDLAPFNGGHCGEYRIVYARATGATDDSNRNFLIFEAALPNPYPDLGLKGCKEVAKLWAGLSKEPSPRNRARALERFYYQGYLDFPPVIHVRNFGDNALGAGQLRTNQFMQPRSVFTTRIWSMREYKLAVAAGLSAVIRPVTVKTNPFGALFASDSTDPRAAEFQDHFLTQVASLATPDFSFNYVVPDRFNATQAQLNGAENNYVTALGGDASPFGARIQARLTAIGSPLTPTNIVNRAQAISCAGCHRLNANPTFDEARRSLGGGLVQPRSVEFTHSVETLKETVGGEEAWVISEALRQFLGDRKRILSDYLLDKLKNPRNPAGTLSGKSHH
jgi:hypothetical protein